MRNFLIHCQGKQKLFRGNKIKEKELKNNSIKETRERLYKAESDSIYMSFIKYSALGQDDKAKEAYDQWLAKVKQIEEENPYIE